MRRLLITILFIACCLVSFGQQAQSRTPIDLQLLRSLVLVVSRQEPALTTETVVRLKMEKPEEFARDWIFVEPEGTPYRLAVSKRVLDIGLMESLLADLQRPSTQRGKSSLVVRWSERTAEFVRKDGGRRFRSGVRLSARAGFPMLVYPVVRFTDETGMSSPISLPGQEMFQDENILEEYASGLPELTEAQILALPDSIGYAVVLPRRSHTVEAELGMMEFAERTLRDVIESQRRKWFEGIEPILAGLVQAMGENLALPRGFVPISEVREPVRSLVEESLRSLAMGSGRTWTPDPSRRIAFSVGVGFTVAGPPLRGSISYLTGTFPYRD